MLYKFIVLHREAIEARARNRGSTRPSLAVGLKPGARARRAALPDAALRDPPAGDDPRRRSREQCDRLRRRTARRELLALGFNISQVVHDYGDICQAITEVAVEQHVPITAEEFHT